MVGIRTCDRKGRWRGLGAPRLRKEETQKEKEKEKRVKFITCL